MGQDSTARFSDPIGDFKAAMAAAGMPCEEVIGDGALHRFSTDGDRGRDKAGWYVLHLDGLPAGEFGDFRSGHREKWCANGGNMPADVRVQISEVIESARRERAEEQAKRHAEAREEAQRRWERAAHPSPEHTYLATKGVQAHGIRELGGELLVPVRDVDGTLHGLQRITADAGKLFLTGTAKGGHFHLIGEPAGVLVIAEGYATAASIHEATGHPVAAAFDCHNLEPVAKALRQKHPDARLIIAGDDDRNTDGNPGRTKAEAAAKAVGATAVFPDFRADERGSDFNDLATLRGPDAVRAAFTASEWFSIPASTVDRFIDYQPPAVDWIVADFLPRGIVGLLVAPGGTGKSFLVLQLATSVATGLPFLNIDVPKKGPVLYLAAEDGESELHRRTRAVYQSLDISNHNGDEVRRDLLANLHIASLVGKDNLITRAVDNECIPTNRVGELIDAIRRDLPGVRLIILDPAVFFRGGAENASEDAARFVQALNRIVAETTATVLVVHHANKDSMRLRNDGERSHAARGSSALTDGARFQANLTPLRREEAGDFGIAEKDAGRYVALTTPKNNYAPPSELRWLERCDSGPLARVDLQREAEIRHEEIVQDVLPKVVRFIAAEGTAGRHYSRTGLAKEFGGKDRRFAVGINRLQGILADAVADGELHEIDPPDPKRNRSKVLSVTGVKKHGMQHEE